MPFLKGPYTRQSQLPAPTVTTIVSSRKLDFARRVYTTDADGNPEGMDDTAQRVIVAHAYAAPDVPRFIDDRAFAERGQQIRAGLAPLVDEHAIKLETVDIAEIGAASARERVTYVNLNTQPPSSNTRTQ